ncbi:MAG: thioesterase family protein [Bacillota bacterium]|nr:thioesterase family protein [Bacillota bacterium]
MYTSITNVRVRYVETDQMGVVHHSKYYVYFELAREDYIKETGIEYRQMEEEGLMMPLVESQCKYYVGAKYFDELEIETKMLEISAVKVVFEYIVRRKADGELIAKGKTVQAFVDKNTFKVINLKKSNIDLWNKMKKLMEE